MATLEAFQDLKDACDELELVTKGVKTHRSLFIRGSNFFQRFVAVHESDYWKIDQDSLEGMTNTVKALIVEVFQLIKIQETIVEATKILEE